MKSLARKGRVAALAVLVAAIGSGARGAGSDAAGPGCDETRPAIAHHAEAEVLDPQPANAPIPCMTITGNAIEAATIGVTRTNTVFFASIEAIPLGANRTLVEPSIVARSRDLGATWENRVPGVLPFSIHGSLSTWLHVDHTTSRVWYATPTAPCGATVSWSDDDGETWGQHPNVGCPGQGATDLVEGPPPAGAAPTKGYPHVVYYCANAAEVPLGDASILMCYKSRDGGTTWRWIGSTPDPIPAAEGCSPTDLRRTRGGGVGPDGVLYFPTMNCGDTMLGIAVSSDEGATWTRKDVVATTIEDLYPPAIGIDTDNNLYIAWLGPGEKPYLVRSADRGVTWSDPLMIGAPGVSSFRRLGIVARSPGHIVVSYLGTAANGVNAYITESRDALGADPIFWSAAANDPSAPVYSIGSESFGNRIQLLRPDIADDGTTWAAFHCYNTAPLCPDGQRLGLVARLLRRP